MIVYFKDIFHYLKISSLAVSYKMLSTTPAAYAILSFGNIIRRLLEVFRTHKPNNPVRITFGIEKSSIDDGKEQIGVFIQSD